MTQKKQAVLYWIVTAPVVAMMMLSAVGLLVPFPQNAEGMVHLGYPSYFMTILGVAKALGSVALLYRRFPVLTEWAYAGFTFVFLSAAYSHFATGDGPIKTVVPLVFLGLLLASRKLALRKS